jgi:hypothetical protein
LTGGIDPPYLASALGVTDAQTAVPLGIWPLVPVGQETGWAPDPVWTLRR